ncbi:hypothetical protein JTB14_032574 [Gonioctena quinquepunctata]|nr:hypothetical protein JTB14_032574 [Gonioctena quinquepunctata]
MQFFGINSPPSVPMERGLNPCGAADGDWGSVASRRDRKWIGFAPLMPFRVSSSTVWNHSSEVPVTTVVGQPMDVPRIENPTTEEIDEYHGRFTEHLTKMFEEQKHNYLEKPEEMKLEII